MKNTPIDKVLVDNTIRSLGIQDFEKATIREVKSVAASVEKESGVEFMTISLLMATICHSQASASASASASA